MLLKLLCYLTGWSLVAALWRGIARILCSVQQPFASVGALVEASLTSPNRAVAYGSSPRGQTPRGLSLLAVSVGLPGGRRMAESIDRPWGSISQSDYRDADQFCAACLIDLNLSGKKKVKNLCKLPVKGPGGAYNRNRSTPQRLRPR